MSYRQEFSNININVLSSGVYDELKQNSQLVSTDFYVVGNKGQNKKVYIGDEPVNEYFLSSEQWTFTLSSGQTYTREVVFKN